MCNVKLTTASERCLALLFKYVGSGRVFPECKDVGPAIFIALSEGVDPELQADSVQRTPPVNSSNLIVFLHFHC